MLLPTEYVAREQDSPSLRGMYTNEVPYYRMMNATEVKRGEAILSNCSNSSTLVLDGPRHCTECRDHVGNFDQYTPRLSRNETDEVGLILKLLKSATNSQR